MSVVTAPPAERSAWLTAAGWRRLFRERPIIPLLGLLGVLVVLSELVRPGIVNADWIGVMLRAAVPLAILAGCQTLTMLTGGIDLSVGAVASMSGFVVATLVGGPGTGVAIIVALVIAGARRPVHGHRRGRLPRPPADHDPGHEPGRARARQRLAAPDGPDGLGRPGHPADASDPSGSRRSCRTAWWSSSRSRH